MAVTIKYTGAQIRWPELSVTGKQSVWNPGQIESREDAEAALLLATGVFTDEGDKPLMLSGGDGLTLGGQALTAGQAAQARRGIGAPVLSPKSILLLGDSITDMCGGLRSDGSYTAPFASSYWVWANAALGQRFRAAVNAGIPGNKLPQMADRFDALVLAHNPSAVLVAGGVNDAMAATTAPLVDTVVAAAKAAISEIITKCQGAGRFVVICTVGPYGTLVAASEHQILARARINAFIRKIAAENDGVALADWDSVLTDPTTNARPIGDVDGRQSVYNDSLVHPNGAGACLIGSCVASALLPHIGPLQPRVARGLSPAQYVSNPVFVGASGATSPTSWTFSSLSTPTTTAAFSYESRADGVNGSALVCQLTASGIMPSGQLQHFVTPTAGLFAVGDKVRCVLEVETEFVSVEDHQLGIYFANTTNGASILADVNVMHDASINSGGGTRRVNSASRLPTSMVIETADLTIQTLGTSFLIKLRLGGTNKFKLKSCTVYKVETD